jgi:hypothetical protein
MLEGKAQVVTIQSASLTLQDIGILVFWTQKPKLKYHGYV